MRQVAAAELLLEEAMAAGEMEELELAIEAAEAARLGEDRVGEAREALLRIIVVPSAGGRRGRSTKITGDLAYRTVPVGCNSRAL